ncbi:hypothetical protein V8E54_001514 [Elaphomyces granulatus]
MLKVSKKESYQEESEIADPLKDKERWHCKGNNGGVNARALDPGCSQLAARSAFEQDTQPLGARGLSLQTRIVVHVNVKTRVARRRQLSNGAMSLAAYFPSRAGLRDVDDVGGVPKLEGKKNYKTWELRIRTLLDSKDEWAAANERDKKDTTKAGLELAEQLRKRKITSPEQATTALIQEINETQSPIEKDEDDDDDDDDDDNDDNDEDKTDNPWRYHKNNKGAVFTITAHVQDHILTKIQGIKSAKLIWIKLQKLYGTTTDLEEFMLLDKLFSISYESATIIDPKIAKSLLLDRLGSFFTEFQARKREAGLKSFTFEDLMTQLLEEDEAKATMAKARASKTSKESKDSTNDTKKCKGCHRSGHTEDKCWILHPELRPRRGRSKQRQASQASLDDTEDLTAMPHPQYVAITEEPSEFAVQLKPSHYTVARTVKNQRIWIYDTGASTHVCNDLSLFENIHDVNYNLNGITGTDKITKVGTVHIPVVQENGRTMMHTASNVFYVPQCPVNLLSASLMKKRAKLILDMHSNKIVDRYSRKTFGIVKERGELFHLLTNYVQDTGLHGSPANGKPIEKTDLYGSSVKAIPTKT